MPHSSAPTLASPLRLRGVHLRNRVVGAPMERNYSDLAGRATPQYAAYLGARAAGGAALLFTEASYVRQDSKARLHQAGMHDDAVLPGLASIARAVHEHGALLGVELNHAGRVVPSAVSQHRPIGPSQIPCAEIGGEVPRELSPSEIGEVVEAFASGAVRALAGGADVVSVHGAHGYLIGQFLSPRSNARTDRYARPSEFLDEVLVAVRDAVGPEVPVFLRWSTFEGLPSGLDIDRSLEVLLQSRLDLVDVVDLSAGTYGAGHWITPSGEVDEGYLADVARRYRQETGLTVSVAGRIVTPAGAARLVEDGATDLVSVARAMHADAEWAKHAVQGTEPRPCISCNQGCADVVFTGKPLWCTANPDTGHEWQRVVTRRATTATTATERGKALVLGSGPAGLQAALALSDAGLRVVLRERAPTVGGQLALSAQLKAKPRFGRLLEWYVRSLAERGVLIETDSEGPASSVEEFLGVVDATGGTDYVPHARGMGAYRLVGIRTWLSRGIPAEPSALTIWGADRAGVYLADHLTGAGWIVTLVGHQTELAPEAGARERLPAVTRLSSSPHVRLHLGAAVEEVLDESLALAFGEELRVVQAPGPVVVSLGAVPAGRVQRSSVIPTVVAGEAAGTRSLDAAVASGDQAARDLLSAMGAWTGTLTTW